MKNADFTPEQSAHVRRALLFLRDRCGGWRPLAAVLPADRGTLLRVARGGAVRASLAVRVARLAAVGVDDVTSGTFPPPGLCPYCSSLSAP